jgi:hypothetical protein
VIASENTSFKGEKMIKQMKIILFTCFIVLCCLDSNLYAASIGNSIQPIGKRKLIFSLEDNIILDKPIKESGTLTSFDFDTVNQTYGKVVFGLAKNINIYVKLGASNIGKIKTTETDASTKEIESNYGFLWGGGLNGSLDIHEGLRVGLDLQYAGWQVTPDKIVESGENATNLSGTIRNQEYQATLFITKEFSMSNDNIKFSPYLGGRYSYFDTETTKTIKYNTTSASYQLDWDLKNKYRVGMLLGADLFFPKYLLQLNVEGRFFDETGISAGLTYKY